MILRRVIAHFRKQEWTAIALDFLIVVVGVFVGLQVSNWNAARMEAHQGAKFAERLKEDMRIEAWNYDVLVGYLEDVRDNVDLALAVLEGRADASDEQLLIYAFRATQYGGGVRRRATYDELTSTGSIGLINDPALRDAAVLFYTAPVIVLRGLY